jgi:hypothetical protein
MHGQAEVRARAFPQGLAMRFGDFAAAALAEQSAQLGVSVEELATFAVLYYLADEDSGRPARWPAARTFPSAADRAKTETDPAWDVLPVGLVRYSTPLRASPGRSSALNGSGPDLQATHR